MNEKQRALLVPGIYGCNSSYINNQSYEQSIVNKLQSLFEWAKNETRIIGFNPWHFNNRSSAQSQGECNMEPGAISMPLVLNKLKEIGQYIVN